MTDKRKNGIAAFALPVLLALVIMAIMGQYPFGENTLLIWDMDWQYSAFFGHLHDILHGDASALYSFSRAIGGNMAGVAAYYLVSPFNLLFYFFDADHIYIGIAVVMLLKIGAIGWSMNCYLYHRRQENFTLIFSTAYALSGYVIGYFFNIMWLDGIMALPLMVLGIEKLVDEKKPFLYLFTIAYGVMTSFYIGYMLCIFSVIYFLCYFFLISESRKSIGTILWYAVSSLLGGALSACVAIPAVYAMQDGKSTFDFSVLKNFTKLFDYKSLVSKSFVGTIHGMQMTSGGPLIYSGVLTLLLAAAFFFLRGISWRKKTAYFFMLLFLAASFGVYNLCCAWQGFNMPVGCPYRFAFIYVFLMLVTAADAYGCLDADKGGGEQKWYRSWNRMAVLAMGIFLLVVLVLFWEDFRNTGRKGVFAVNIVLVLAYTLILVPGSSIRLGSRAGSGGSVGLGSRIRWRQWLLCGLMGAELCLNAVYLYQSTTAYQSTTVSEYEEYLADVGKLVDEVKEEDGMFRTVMTDDAYRTVNDSILFNLYGLDSYTSLEEKNMQEIAFELGYYQHMVLGIHYKEGSTQAAESLLGVKYRITSLTAQTLEASETGYLLVDTDGDLGLYENQNVLRFAMLADETILAVTNEEYNTFEYQNVIYASLCDTLDEPVFTSSQREIVSLENCEQNPDGSFSLLDVERDGYVEYRIEVEKEGYQYLQYMTSEASGVTAFVNGEEINPEEQGSVVKHLGYLSLGDEVYIRCYFEGEEPCSMAKVYVYYEDSETLSAYAREINAQKVEVTSRLDDQITVSCTNEKEEASWLLLTIPYDDGWHITIDGVTAEADTVLGGMMLIAVEPGEHVIKLNFVPKGLYEGFAITGAVVVLLILIGVSFRRKKRSVKDNFVQKLHILAVIVLALSAVMIWMGYGQDIEFHAERIATIAAEMKNGLGIYRIYTTVCDGYGYASPLFYGDIFLYPAAALVACGVPLRIVFRLLLASIMFFSYLSMYLCARSVWGKNVAVTAAYLYAFSPVLFTDLFIRYAVGEATAFVFIPLVLFGFYRIVIEPKHPKTDWIFLALGMSGLILSHIISSVLMVLLLALLCIWNVKKIWADKKRVVYILYAALLTVGITAYFTLPLLEQMAASTFYVTGQQSDFVGNTAPLIGLFFGSEYMSVINVILEKLTGTADYFSFSWFPGAFGYLLFFVLFARIKKRDSLRGKETDTLLGFGILYLTMSVVPFIQPLLKPFVGFIQFPWRNLVFYNLFLSMCAALLLHRLKDMQMERWYKTGMCAATFGTLVAFAGLAMITVHNGMFPFEKLSTTSIGLGEYLPSAVSSYDYSLERGDEVRCSDDGVTYEFRRCDGYSELSYEGVDGEATFEVPVYMYLGYDVVNEATGVSYEPVISENGLVEFTVDDSGVGVVKIYYKGTTVQKISVWVSFATLLALAAVWVKSKKDWHRGTQRQRFSRENLR